MLKSMNEVIPGLWIGGICAATNLENLRINNIKRIVSVCDYNPFLPDDCSKTDKFPIEEFQYHFVKVLDDVDQDLIDYFDDCFKFIQEGLEKKLGVLVHCQMGVSRSATIVIGYLMYTEGLLLDLACKKVNKARPIVSPNPGFIAQLSLFEAMGCRVDQRHPRYRQYKLTKFAQDQRYNASGSITASDIPCLADPTNSDDLKTIYRCRRCRRPLFRSAGLLTHPTYQPKGSASDQRLNQLMAASSSASDPDADGDDYWMAESPAEAAASAAAAAVNADCRRELFVEPVEWMRSEAGSALSGKLTCPNLKCSAKIGSFNWVGERCSCGQFVCPAFHVRSQAVDAPMPPTQLPVQVAVAKPPASGSETSG